MFFFSLTRIDNNRGWREEGSISKQHQTKKKLNVNK